MAENTKELQIAGQLFWMNDVYLLADPDPLIERRHWMTDNMKEFVVCQENGHVFSLVVTPPFAVSYRRMGDKIEIKTDKQEAQTEQDENWSLENIAKIYSNMSI